MKKERPNQNSGKDDRIIPPVKISSGLETSNVPEKYYDALQNVYHEVKNYRHFTGDIHKEVVRRSLGIEPDTITTDEALYLIGRGKLIALEKRLQGLNKDGSQKGEFTRYTQQMINITVHLTELEPKLLRNARNRLQELHEQLEQRVIDPRVAANISLLANPRRI